MLRDGQDILDVTLVCGDEDGWRDKRILPQGWKMIFGQQMEWLMNERWFQGRQEDVKRYSGHFG